MGDAGFNKGGLFGRNFKGGEVSFSSTESSVSVSFDRPMKGVPVVSALNSADTDVWKNTKSQTGFTLDRASTGSSETVDWIAYNDDRA